MLPPNLTPRSLLDLEANPHLAKNVQRLAQTVGLEAVHVERFVKGINYEPDGCWLWLLGHGARAPGMFNIRRRCYYVHRISYELFVGPIPDAMCVCHTCDVRDCANPYHYFIGTRADNNKDAGSKGILPHGEDKYNAKLTEGQIREIRELYEAGGIYQRALAKRFNTDQGSISRIVNKKLWRHTI